MFCGWYCLGPTKSFTPVKNWLYSLCLKLFLFLDCIKIKSYTEGNRVKQIKIGNKVLSGVEVRTIFSLKSANFSIEIGKSNIKFKVIGYGHGVGLSQTGSNTLAKQGKSYVEIIKHFYSGVEVQSANY